MKKIFGTLAMALCLAVMVSCGGGKSGGSPIEVAGQIELTFNNEAAPAIQKNDAEMFLKAVEKYFAAKNNAEKFDPEDIDPEIMQEYDHLVEVNAGILNSGYRQFRYDFDDAQRERFHKATGMR